MNNTLLVGNGILRSRTDFSIRNNDYSWTDLLKDLAALAEVEIFNIENKPLPLVYEEIRIKALGKKSLPADLNQKLTKLMNKISSNYLIDVYSSIAKNTLTTNYDSHFRRGIGFEGVIKQLFPNLNERYHSLFRHDAYTKRNLWYIHGHRDEPRSILLGHSQYAKYMGQIKDYLYKGIKYSKHPDKLKSTLLGSDPDFKFDEKDKIYSWVDLYLRDHIHVVGFGMDFCESILWWLTIEKMALKIKYPKHVGGITYYTINIPDQKKDPAKLRVLSALKDFGAEIVEIEAENYVDGYEKIANILKPELVWRYRNEDYIYIKKNI